MKTITPKELQQHIESGENIFLKISKTGCGICKLSVSATDRLEQNNIHDLAFYEINSSAYPEIHDITDTESLPCFFIFAGKQLTGKFVGFKGLQKLTEFVENSFK